MIVFLNYLPTIIWLLGTMLMGYFFFKKKNPMHTIYTGLVLVVIALALKAITPSYMPKGEVPKMPITHPEAKVLPPLEDRSLKPVMTDEERKKSFDEKFDAVKQSK